MRLYYKIKDMKKVFLLAFVLFAWSMVVNAQESDGKYIEVTNLEQSDLDLSYRFLADVRSPTDAPLDVLMYADLPTETCRICSFDEIFPFSGISVFQSFRLSVFHEIKIVV